MKNPPANLSYPIGQFEPPTEYSAQQIAHWIEQIAAFPQQLRTAVAGWSDDQLDTPYRPGGWTVRQVIHHVADSHMNSYVRFKWSLTEDTPTIKAYDEKLWAELPEAKSAPPDLSLDLLDSLHRRWVVVLQNLSPSDLEKAYLHPETGKTVSLATNVASYAWHSQHHLHHVLGLKNGKTGNMDIINISEKFTQIEDHWHPRIIGELNGQHVKIAKIQGEFIWHQHAEEDEMFLVIDGHLFMDFRDRTVELHPGEMLIVPKGVEHRPRAEAETQIMMFEPASTLNTGNVVDEHTKSDLERL